jgi:hypothetical protein
MKRIATPPDLQSYELDKDSVFRLGRKYTRLSGQEF